ncbi:helix-turn-helix domain-containing protein [Nitrospirillum sp. BR 11828]|uniref:TetR/AcrR family transcriptional regulator n=1 Tax=Nitrospirillum sp. BR 11828 TaxID=3104325 RepID=UPI002ACAEF10|nr:helix-turn-helix domain-containing protein [Nitrospirillum sp. BR 11828]MDZ5647115.1 helix-turn-helix domain-containing protein [Nitrospirillum sp. BR 11828]
MSSQKSTTDTAAPIAASPEGTPPAGPKMPSRERGRARVAALLAAASAVFAEKGYDAATMTEIAARAGAPIGSLYQFFPTKAVLADALLARYADALVALLADLESRAAALSPAALAAALLAVLPSLKVERAAAFALIDARPDMVAQQGQLRARLRQGIAAVLRAKSRALPAERAATMAVTLLQMMKGAAALGDEPDLALGREAQAGLVHAAGLFLTDALA